MTLFFTLTDYQKLIVVYFFVVNLLTIFFYTYDKYLAMKYKRKAKKRVKESTLILLALLGGSLFSMLSIFLLRHKTRKIKFTKLIPIFFIIQSIILYKLSFLL